MRLSNLLYPILVLGVSGITSGCSDPAGSKSNPTRTSTLPAVPVVTDLPDEDAAMPYMPATDEGPWTAAESIKAKHETRLMSIEGVEGVGIAKDESGRDVLMLYLRDESVNARIPGQIEGIPLHTTLTPKIDAH